MKPKLLKSDTRQWTSGRVRFAVVEIPDHPEKNYLVLEKSFFGRSRQDPQKFIMHLHDWKNLKRLVDGEKGLAKEARWVKQVVVNPKNIQDVISNTTIVNPVLQKIGCF